MKLVVSLAIVKKMMNLGFLWAISLARAWRDLSNIDKIPKFIMKIQYYIGLDVHKE
jgi:hypothetical protein